MRGSGKNYRFICTVDNFSTLDKELDFGDFKIIKVQQGADAAQIRKKLHCKSVPKHILMKEFFGYVRQEDDISGVDNITKEIQNLLVYFRLFDIGDIGFGNYVFENKDDEQSSLISTFNSANISPGYNYSFDTNKIRQFNEFKKEMVDKPGYKNKFFQFALSYFMKGMDRGFFHNYMLWGGRIVDYFIGLESLFLIDGEKIFLRKTIAKRIKKFLSGDASERLIKNMYNERSNFVHGVYMEMGDNKNIKQQDKEDFERLLRKIFLKLCNHNFNTKEQMSGFMKKLFEIPEEIIKIMLEVQIKAENKFNELESRDTVYKK